MKLTLKAHGWLNSSILTETQLVRNSIRILHMQLASYLTFLIRSLWQTCQSSNKKEWYKTNFLPKRILNKFNWNRPSYLILLNLSHQGIFLTKIRIMVDMIDSHFKTLDNQNLLIKLKLGSKIRPIMSRLSLWAQRFMETL